MSEEDGDFSLHDDGDNGHAGEDLDVDLALVDSIKSRFKVLVHAVKSLRAEMREERRKMSRRIFRIELIGFGVSGLVGLGYAGLKAYIVLREAKLVP